MADYDTSWDNETARPSKANVVSLFHVTTRANLPTSGFETGAKFLISDEGIIVENTGNKTTCSWTDRTPSKSKEYDTVIKLSTSLSDYSTPASATASSTAAGSPMSFTDNFSSSTGWTTVGTAWAISGGLMVATNVPANAEHRMYKTVGGLPDTGWIFDFDAKITSLPNGDPILAVLLSDSTNFNNDALDAIRVVFANESPSNALRITLQALDAGSSTASTSINFSLNTQYYLRVERTSATQAKLSVFSDSARTTHISGSPVTLTINSTINNLQYIQFSSINHGVSVQASGEFDNVNISWTEQFTASNVLDGSTGTRWKSTSSNNPWIRADLTSARDIVALALNLDRANTTETQIQVQTSTDDINWTTRRTINVSDFTDGVWRYILLNRLEADARYVRIRGVSNNVVLAIYEIKVRYGLTDTVMLRNHYHRKLSATSVESGVDSN